MPNNNIRTRRSNRAKIATKAKISILITFSSILSLVSINIEASANQNVRFYCARQANGFPRTIASLSGTEHDVIIWSRLYERQSPASIAGVNDRCNNTSRLFQRAYDEGLYHLTSGRTNMSPVICASSRQGGDCNLVLFRLDSRDDPNLALKRLFDMQSLTPSSFPLDQNQRVYIDIRDVILR